MPGTVSQEKRSWICRVLSFPFDLLARLTAPVPPGLWLLNVVVQRGFRVNGRIPWMVHFTSRVRGNIEIGDRVWQSFALSGGCYIQGLNSVRIGHGTLFAPGVKIISADHDASSGDGWLPSAPIVIGERCWIGANAVILPGVQLGDGVVVGAGAVVTRSFRAGVVVAGVPAREIGRVRGQEGDRE